MTSSHSEAMFSLEETRDELERLREEVAPMEPMGGAGGVLLCPLPASVPPLARGLFITADMQDVLDAVYVLCWWKIPLSNQESARGHQGATQSISVLSMR